MQDEGDDSQYRDHVLAKDELRRSKANRSAFVSRPRNPVTVVLDGVTGNCNRGAIFRLCDAFLVDHLIICHPAEWQNSATESKVDVTLSGVSESLEVPRLGGLRS